MGICFVGEVPMKEFLSSKIKFKKGKIMMSNGQVVGEHDGLFFYTIGQRHWGAKNLQVPWQKGETKPLYVVGKDLKKNILTVGFADDKLLFKKEIILPKIHWISGVSPKTPFSCKARLRHRQELQVCRLVFSKGKYLIKFEKKQRAITPGQFIVFYLEGKCLGGGEIV
jgi:tRNA-specific 2-thiouridylase